MGCCVGKGSRSSLIDSTAAGSVNEQRTPATRSRSHVPVDHAVGINSSSRSRINLAENLVSSNRQQSSSNDRVFFSVASKNLKHTMPSVSYRDSLTRPASTNAPSRSWWNSEANTVVSTSQQQLSLTDTEIVIRASKYLEHALKESFEATGDGLGQYLRSAKNNGGSLPSDIQKTISNIVSKRNMIVHQPECNTLIEKSKFVADFKNAWHSLKHLSSCPNHCSVCKDADQFLQRIQLGNVSGSFHQQ